MTDGASEVSPRVATHQGCHRNNLIRFHFASIVFVGLAAVCVGCQSIPNVERSSPLSDDMPLPSLPSSEADGDAESEGDARRELGTDAPADGSDAEPRPFLGFPIGKLLDDSPNDEDDDPPKRKPVTRPDIREPGPDTANFPNSPHTLPQGRAYIETSPVFISGPSRGTPPTYNAEFLIRYGLTDRVELRLFGNGPTFERGALGSNGFGPLAWDIKTNLWKENEEYHIPAVGLEVFLLTASGSKKLNQGTQPSITLLFSHTLPFDIILEWNVGLVGDPSLNNSFSSIEPAAAWAFEREIFNDFFFFFQGYFNGPTLPRYGDGVELGGGVRWTLTDRLALWASYNGGVSKEAPTTLFYLGGAMAF
jgi:Putative MetA-pathway of phenol degradation